MPRKIDSKTRATKKKNKKRQGRLPLPAGLVRDVVTTEGDDHLQINYWLFASEKVALGHYPHEICELAKVHFKLEKAPSRQTMHNWLDRAMKLKLDMISANLEQRRVLALDKIALLLRKWLPIATADQFTIQRTKKEDGETVTYLDEDAYDEQIKAGNLCAKLIMQQAELEGLLKDVKPGDSKGSKDWQQFVTDAVLNSIVHPRTEPKVIEATEIERVTLTLEAGDRAIEALK